MQGNINGPFKYSPELGRYVEEVITPHDDGKSIVRHREKNFKTKKLVKNYSVRKYEDGRMVVTHKFWCEWRYVSEILGPWEECCKYHWNGKRRAELRTESISNPFDNEKYKANR